MALPQVTLTGNLTDDPQLRFTNAGKPWITFRVACTDRRKEANGEWVDGDTTFIDVTSWLRAEALNTALLKGMQVMVAGQLKSREYEDSNGAKRTAYDIKADSVAIVVKDTAGKSTPTSKPAAPSEVPSSWVPVEEPLDIDAPF